MKYYYINLDHRKDRKEHIENELLKSGIRLCDIERFPAIDAKELGITPQQACTLSHLNLLRKWHKGMVIFEDDAVISDNFTELFENYLHDLPHDWDIFYIGANHRQSPSKISDFIYKANEPYCTHAYMVSESGAKKIIKAFEEDKIAPPDPILANMVMRRELNAYCAWPVLSWQLANHSDIEGRFMSYDWMVPQ